MSSSPVYQLFYANRYRSNPLRMSINSDPIDRCGNKDFHTDETDLFYPACKRHDHNYNLHEGQPLSVKMQDDKQLWDDMMTIIRFKNAWWALPKAMLYYSTALIIGYWYWD